MEKKQSTESKLVISKRGDYKDHKISTGLEKSKDSDFNLGKKVEVTEKDFNRLIKFDWCVGG